MVIGEAPGSGEDQTGIPFSGRSGLLLRRTLKEIGVDPRTVFITNTVACRPPMNRTPSRTEAKTCSSLFLIPQIDLVKPKVILLLGNTAVQFVTGRKAAVTKLEGSTITYNGITCVPCRHPSAVCRVEDIDRGAYNRALAEFKLNLILFRRLLDPKSVDKIKFSKEPIELDKNIPYTYTDIETNGLDPFKPDAKIWCFGFAQSSDNVCSIKNEPDDLFNDEVTRYVKFTLKHYSIMVQRAGFEGTWYRRHFGITPRIYHDTKVSAYLIDENEQTGLKYQAVKCLNVEPWEEGQNFRDPDFNTLMPYNARDLKYSLRLYHERDLPFFKKNPKIAKLMRYIILPSSEVLIEMVCNGFHIDEILAKRRLEICEQNKRKLNDKINSIASAVTGEEEDVNPGSPKQMAKLLYEDLGLICQIYTDKGKKSTGEAARIRLKGQHKIIGILDEWHKWEKYESTYFTPWIKRGPILHANYDNTGTDTGRLSSSMVKDKRGQKKLGAVIHQCPRDPFVRTIISPRGYLPSPFLDACPPGIKAHPEDWCLVASDLSQIELRLVAHCAQEPTMIKIFNDPTGDIHIATARTLQPEGEIEKETRKKAKAVNFGFVYGMWWRKFIAYALEKFNLRLSENNGKEYRRKFFEKYSGLLPWHRRVEAFVGHNGYIDSPIGRRRHLPEAKITDDTDFENDWVRKEKIRQAINSPIQGMASDLMMLILALICSYSLDWKFKIDRQKAFPMGTAHDSGLFECHKSYAQELKEGILWTIKNLPLVRFFGVEMLVPILIDVSIFDNHWEFDGTPEELKKLTAKVD
jgi:DNA polymerase-1